MLRSFDHAVADDYREAVVSLFVDGVLRPHQSKALNGQMLETFD
jgi:hypothetical protein